MGKSKTNIARQNITCKLRHQSLMIQWIQKVTTNNQWQYIYVWLVPQLKEKIWKCTLLAKDIDKICQQNSYWKDVLKLWSHIQAHEPSMQIVKI